MRQLTLTVEGMKCGGCAGSVQAALEEVPGVLEAVVSHEEGEARLVVEDSVEMASLSAAVETAGYRTA